MKLQDYLNLLIELELENPTSLNFVAQCLWKESLKGLYVGKESTAPHLQHT
ncbi:hypothetical protein DPMN_152211 [Dreissena polymorpha]|uniref:Uncharacterized protein n=1 Tax=Dreissena polymorpha TaxID=45954 RepID=A0A9D4FKW4_DREPO|nr:hypothetical protein DPMN_152211 [Dreissena polymorpha]